MTGYGRGSAEQQETTVTVEIASVNRKQMDLRIGLPREIATLEPVVRAAVQREISRGSVNVSVNLQLSAEYRKAQLRVDEDVAAHLVAQLKTLAGRLGIGQQITLSDIVALPGVVVAAETVVAGETIARMLEEALAAALADLRRMQAEEGEALARDLRERRDALLQLLQEIEDAESTALPLYRERLQKRLEQLGAELRDDDERLARELAFAAERSDVAEETVRLRSHLEQMGELIEASEPPGRALDFLCQEIGREINTLAAKTCDLRTSNCTLAFKNEIGRIREQVSNIE